MKEKKIIETNFCTISMKSQEVNPVEKDSMIDVKVNCINLYHNQNKPDGKRGIKDNGAPKSAAETPWINNYIKENNITREDLIVEEVEENFKFGPGEVFPSTEKTKIPIISDCKY